MEGARNWREVSAEWAVNEQRVEAFTQLMESQQRIAVALTPHGVTDAQLERALAAAEAALPRDEHDQRDFYLPALGLYVGALDGVLEPTSRGLRAVFPEVRVDLDRLGLT
jgi:hypothetical protein